MTQKIYSERETLEHFKKLAEERARKAQPIQPIDIPEEKLPADKLPADKRGVLLFDYEQAKELFGYELPNSSWRLKGLPTNYGYEWHRVRPDGVEITRSGRVISPEGKIIPQEQFYTVEGFDRPVSETELKYIKENLPRGQARIKKVIAQQKLKSIEQQEEWEKSPEKQVYDALNKIYTDQDITQVVNFIQTEPKVFAEQMKEYGRSPETVTLLRATGWNDQQISFNFMSDGEKVEFYNDLLKQGQSAETEAIIREINPDIEQKTIDKFFEQVEIEEPPDYIPEDKWKDRIDAFYLGTVEAVHMTKQFFKSDLPKLLSKIYSPLWTEEAKKNAVDTANERYAMYEEKMQDWYEAHPELKIKPEYEKWNIKKMKDPDYLMYQIARYAPPTLAAMIPGMVVFGVTGSPAAGAAAGAMTFFPMVSHDSYVQLKESGADEDTAIVLAPIIGGIVSGLEMASDIPQLIAFKPALGIFRKALIKGLVENTLIQLIKRGITTVGTITFAESFTEIAQDVVMNVSLNYFDKNRSIIESIPETFFTTLVVTSPFAIFGGATSMIHVSTPKALAAADKTGWTQDEMGEWYQLKKLVDIMKEQYQKFRDAGLSIEEAKVKALTFMAMTEEGADALGRFAKELAVSEVGAIGKEPKAVGKETIAYGADPTKSYKMRYRIVELNDLVTSHTDAFAPNPEYPSELQPRLRERGAGRLAVMKIAKTLVPEVLIQDNNMIDRGSMIVGADNVVESGNGRVMALRLAQQTYPEKWLAYQESLKEALPQFGIASTQLSGMQNPVLVRERISDVDRVQFTSEANQPAVAVFSPLENALQDAKRIRLDNLSIPDGVQSIDATLRMASNRPFITSFLETLPANERASLLDSDGNLNLLGMSRIKAAMFARTYQGNTGRRLTRVFFESREPLIRNIEEGMIASLPKMAYAEDLVRLGDRASELSIAEDLAASLDMLAMLRQRKLSVDQYLAQRQMFERELTPFQERLLKYVEGMARSSRKVREFLTNYADAVIASAHPQQAVMVAGKKVTKEGLFDATVRREKEGALFATGEGEIVTISPTAIGESGLVAEELRIPEAEQAAKPIDVTQGKPIEGQAEIPVGKLDITDPYIKARLDAVDEAINGDISKPAEVKAESELDRVTRIFEAANKEGNAIEQEIFDLKQAGKPVPPALVTRSDMLTEINDNALHTKTYMEDIADMKRLLSRTDITSEQRKRFEERLKKDEESLAKLKPVQEVPSLEPETVETPATEGIEKYQEYIGDTIKSKTAEGIKGMAGKASGKVEQIVDFLGEPAFRIRLADKSTLDVPVSDAILIRKATEGEELTYPREIPVTEEKPPVEAPVGQKEVSEEQPTIEKPVAEIKPDINAQLLAKGYSQSQIDRMTYLEKVDFSDMKQPPPPPPPPPKLPSTAIQPKPVPQGKRVIDKIIAFSTEQVKQDRPQTIARIIQAIPGIKQLVEFERPGLKMTDANEKILVAWVAATQAKSDVLTRTMPTSLPVIRAIQKTFGRDALHGKKTDIKFIGTKDQKTSIEGTLLDIFQRPSLYELTTEQKSVISQWGEHTKKGLKYVVDGYGAEIGEFKPSDPEGVYVPNVDVGEDILKYMSESRAVSTGRGKTRFYDSAAARLKGKTFFTPELNMEKLLGGIDTFQASVAAGNTFRQVLGGLTKLEAMETTHPELYKSMMMLRAKLQKLKGYQNILKEETFTAIDDFLVSPSENVDILKLQADLDVKLEAGRYVAKAQAGKTLEDIQNEIDMVKADIKDLRPSWETANLKPYVFIQEGLYRYFPAKQAQLIKEMLKTTNNPILNIMELVRGTAFSGDLSPIVGIQTPLGALFTPLWDTVSTSAGAAKKAIQEGDIIRSFTADKLAQDIGENPIIWAEFFSLVGRQPSGTPREFAGGLLHYIPGFSGFNEATYTVVTRQAFHLWNRLTNSLMKSGLSEIVAKVAAADQAMKVYPLMSPTRLGQSTARHTLLRALPTSYSFIRQPLAMIGDSANALAKIVTRQTLTPRERLSLRLTLTLAGNVLAVSALSAFLDALRRDDDPIKAMLDAINPDPMNGKFINIIVPIPDSGPMKDWRSIRVPLGGPYRSIFRALYPQPVEGIPFPVPFAGIPKYLWNRFTPAIKTQITLAPALYGGEPIDYYGRRILTGETFLENFLRGLEYEMENIMPLTIGTTAEAIRTGEPAENVWQNIITQFAGVNAIELNRPARITSDLIDQLGQEEKPKYDDMSLSIKRLKIIDTKELVSDILQRINWVLKNHPEDLTVKNGYDPIVIEIVKMIETKKITNYLPNTKIYKINTDPMKGDTFKQYNDQWERRLEIVASGNEKALIEHDDKYPNAYLGNLTRRQMDLMTRYAQLDPRDKRQFVKDNKKELNINPFDEWMKSNPGDNARYAVLGQLGRDGIPTRQIYDLAVKMIKDLDIPDNAVEMYVPSKENIDYYFKYQDALKEHAPNSWEVKLLLAKDEKLRLWLNESGRNREPIETPIESLEIKTIPKYHEIFDKLDDKDYLDTLSDVELADGLSERDRYIKGLKSTPISGGLTYRDLERKVDVIERIGKTSPDLSPEGIKLRDKLVDAHLAKMHLSDEFSGGSAQVKQYLMENEEYWKWAMAQKGMLTDMDPEEWDKRVIDINVEYYKQDREVKAIKVKYDDMPANEVILRKPDNISQKAWDYKNLSEKREILTANETADLKNKNPEFEIADWKRDAYNLDADNNTADLFVEYNQTAKEFGASSAEAMLYRWRNKGLNDWGMARKNWEPIEESDVIGLASKEKWRVFDDRYNEYKDSKSPLYIANDEARERARRQWLNQPENLPYRDERWRRDARDKHYPESLVADYVAFQKLPRAKEQWEWQRFLRDNPRFYKLWRADVKEGDPLKEEVNFAWIPTPEVEGYFREWDKKNAIGKLEHDSKFRDAFRKIHRDLDQWLFETGRVEKMLDYIGGSPDIDARYVRWQMQPTQAAKDDYLAQDAILRDYLKREKNALDALKANERAKATAQMEKNLEDARKFLEELRTPAGVR